MNEIIPVGQTLGEASLNVPYCVNKNAQNTGEHEVHKISCTSPYLPDEENRIHLGRHADCHSAVRKAREIYNNVDGCYHCCRPCHNR